MTKVLTAELEPNPNIILPKGITVAQQVEKWKADGTIPKNSTYKIILEIKGSRD
jgi:hypothetical protein